MPYFIDSRQLFPFQPVDSATNKSSRNQHSPAEHPGPGTVKATINRADIKILARIQTKSRSQGAALPNMRRPAGLGVLGWRGASLMLTGVISRGVRVRSVLTYGEYNLESRLIVSGWSAKACLYAKR